MAVLQPIYELKKNWHGQTDGQTSGEIEGSTRGPRGPKKRSVSNTGPN